MNDSRYQTGNPVCDAAHFCADAALAIFPRDVAHQIGEVKKNFWSGVRWFAGKNIEWIDEAVAGSDRLREEWRRQRGTAGRADFNEPDSVNPS